MAVRFDAAGVTITVHPGQIVEYDYGGLPTIDVEQARRTLEATQLELEARGIPTPRPTLVKMGNVTRVSREARAYFAEGELNRRLVTKVALIATNPVSRLIGNFFLGLNRSQRPTRLFEDADTALVWLREP